MERFLDGMRFDQLSFKHLNSRLSVLQCRGSCHIVLKGIVVNTSYKICYDRLLDGSIQPSAKILTPPGLVYSSEKTEN